MQNVNEKKVPSKKMNYARFINAISAGRKPSPIRTITELISRSPPSMISLAAGAPNGDMFPYESVSIKMKDGSTISLDSKKTTTALQYANTPGIPEFLERLQNLQKKMHSPPALDGGAEMEICVTNGSQDALCKSFEAFCSKGENVLIDRPTYIAPLAILPPLGTNLLAVESDEQGMKPDKLKEALSRWSPDAALDPSSDVPKIIYLVPNGLNPSGSILPLDRREQIYQIARDYDMLIMEDDPYYFLQFEERLPSFLSMDQDGRVLRYDSFSKILSSGLRCGFMTGPAALVKQIKLHHSVSSLHTSSMSQMIINETLSTWGIDGFVKYTEKVRDFYADQRDVMEAALEKHLKGLAEWHAPKAGMFFWIKLLGVEDSYTLIHDKLYHKGVMCVPGVAFMTDAEKYPYVRLSFSKVTPEQIDVGIQRLAEAVKEERGIS